MECRHVDDASMHACLLVKCDVGHTMVASRHGVPATKYCK